ncbi:MAG: single-stranded-DNA-specific exonuclease RecJ [Chitinivorax sp.]
MPRITTRPFQDDIAQQLGNSGLSPLMARIYAARGVISETELDTRLARLLPYHSLKNIDAAAKRLADAVQQQQKLLIVADYDSDGATACAVAVKALRAFGALVDFIVPNRFEYGYGLTPEIVELAAQLQPQLLITVDNGIASLAGVAEAQRRGIEVLITDHHLPGDSLPDALIVNPNQPGCEFPSKNLAGVGVIFYVMLALRAELRQRGAFGDGNGPNLGELLDLVALGTVADVVKLDANNRILVEQGLARMRAGKASAGIKALFQVAGRSEARTVCFDLGFALGPRLNAAGRLDDMSLGIACLLADNADQALQIAADLDRLNRERRSIESGMQDEALAQLDGIDVDDSYSLSLYREDWHQGVIGILASRIKDKHFRPTIVFAPGNAGELKGSGRSIPTLHLRDALDLVSKRHPDLILKFGGHAAAAGLTIRETDLAAFRQAFEQVCREWLDSSALEREIATDGELGSKELQLQTAVELEQHVWGQGFPQPAFRGRFRIAAQRVVGEKHLKLRLAHAGQLLDAILFQQNQPLPDEVELVYRPSVNEYQGNRSLQLIVEYWA